MIDNFRNTPGQIGMDALFPKPHNCPSFDRSSFVECSIPGDGGGKGMPVISIRLNHEAAFVHREIRLPFPHEGMVHIKINAGSDECVSHETLYSGHLLGEVLQHSGCSYFSASFLCNRAYLGLSGLKLRHSLRGSARRVCLDSRDAPSSGFSIIPSAYRAAPMRAKVYGLNLAQNAAERCIAGGAYHFYPPPPKAEFRPAFQRAEPITLPLGLTNENAITFLAHNHLAPQAEFGSAVRWFEIMRALIAGLRKIICHGGDMPHTELKSTYFAQAVKNLASAGVKGHGLFDIPEAAE